MHAGGPGGFMPPSHRIAEKNKEPKPENLRQVPGYIKRVVVKFFQRLFYIFTLVWETNPWILTFLVLLSAAEGLLPIAGTYISAQIINALSLTLTGGELLYSALGVLFVFQFAYLFLNRLTSDVHKILSNLSGELVTNHIRRKIMHKVKDIDAEAFDRPDFYEGLENANREAGMRPIQILNAALNIISVTVSMAGFIIILAGISGWAPLLVALLALPSAIVSFIYRNKTAGYLRIRSKARRQMNYYSSAVVDKDMMKEIRLLGLNDEFERRYDGVFRDYFKGLKRLILQEGAWNVGLGVLRILVNCFLFYFVATLVMEKQIRIGDYSFYTGALSSVSTGVATFINGTASIYEGTLFIDNLIAFMKQRPAIRRAGKPETLQTGVGHTIEFDHVSFRYPGSDHDVICDFSFKLSAGETVALVGFNGAGKTTLIKLLTRLYDPTEGAILLDGKDIRQYDLREYYRLFGIVFQDFGRYAFTVRDNIRFGNIDKNAPDEDVRRAAGQSDALSYIERLPKGLDTPLMRYFEEDGTELSTGQWQKLAVARAFYGDKDILILDEPTASLDALAEQEIFRQFDALRRGKTTVFVSHRLSSAVEADKIAVIENGRLAEQGTHESLMKTNGLYAKMFTAQAKKYMKK